MDEPPYTSAEFHNDVQKQLLGAVTELLMEAKLDWSQVAPVLDAARALCRDDVRLNGRLALHGNEYQGEELAPAEEAFLSLSVRDREDNSEWLAETYWLSDIALAEEDPAQVRATLSALERSLDKVRRWLDTRPAQAAASQEPGQEEAGEADGPAGVW
jgi:hypothetical protein